MALFLHKNWTKSIQYNGENMSKVNLIIGYIVVCTLGVLSHFAFDFIKIDYLKAVFPSNESIFEHLKLFIFPALLYMLVDIVITKNKTGILSSYISGIIVASIFMICSYYTYSGIVGQDNSIINILIFFICVGIIFFYRYKKITLFEGANSVIALIVFLLIIEIFSFYPTDINLFQNPTPHEAQIESLLSLFQ